MDAYLINADYTLTELAKREVEAEKIADMVKKYILSFYRFYNVMKNAGINHGYLQTYLERIQMILEKVSEDVMELLPYERFTEKFYEDEAIRSMIRQNTLITATLDDFLDFVFDVET